jgi:hypothetical protein
VVASWLLCDGPPRRALPLGTAVMCAAVAWSGSFRQLVIAGTSGTLVLRIGDGMALVRRSRSDWCGRSGRGSAAAWFETPCQHAAES